MSFVLNALRRADAERERGTVPDLHAHAPASLGATTPGGKRWLVWALAVASAALLMALAAVLWLGRDTPAAVAKASSAPAATPSPVAIAPVVAPPPPPPPAPAPQVLIRIETAPAPAPAPAVRPAAREKPVAAAAEPPIVKWKDLPEAQRRAMPPMAFGGAMDSSVAANRMLVINGRVVREGEEAERGVVLERIKLNSAILRYKGQRIEVSY